MSMAVVMVEEFKMATSSLSTFLPDIYLRFLADIQKSASCTGDSTILKESIHIVIVHLVWEPSQNAVISPESMVSPTLM